MSLPLLSREDLADLPDADQEAFVQLEEIARRRLYENGEDDQNGHVYYPHMAEYMTRVSALAEEFGVPGIQYNRSATTENEFNRFIHAVDFQTTQINVRVARENAKSLVDFRDNSRTKIQHHLEQMKQIIIESDIPERRARSLLDRISDFEKELAKRRVNIAVAMAVIALSLAAARDFQEIATDLVRPTEAITEVVSQEQVQHEETTQLRVELAKAKQLNAPPKAITDQTTDRAKGAFDELDDDVPF
ncbi:MAG: hypothetical protein AAFW97_03135 [Pseudomonadota bacterium]